MKIVNRGFLLIRPKQAFADWANQFDLDFEVEIDDLTEAGVYLVEEDFMEAELLLEQNFKKIFEAELSQITEEETDWPEQRTISVFEEWFDWEAGTTVLDLEKNDLKVYRD